MNKTTIIANVEVTIIADDTITEEKAREIVMKQLKDMDDAHIKNLKTFAMKESDK